MKNPVVAFVNINYSSNQKEIFSHIKNTLGKIFIFTVKVRYHKKILFSFALLSPPNLKFLVTRRKKCSIIACSLTSFHPKIPRTTPYTHNLNE